METDRKVGLGGRAFKLGLTYRTNKGMTFIRKKSNAKPVLI